MRSLVYAAACIAVAAPAHADDFVRGDVNSDGFVDLADAAALIAAGTAVRPELRCEDAADADDDGQLFVRAPAGGIDLDTDRLLDWLFALSEIQTAPPLAPPFPRAGADLSRDDLGCNDGFLRPPPAADAAYGFDWATEDFLLLGQEEVEFFLTVRTGAAVQGFSAVFLVNTDVLDVQGIDLAGTAFPAALRRTFESSALFRWTSQRSVDPSYRLILVGALFLDDALDVIRFPVTVGAVRDLAVLRLVAGVRPDAPTGKQHVLRKFTGHYADSIDLLIGGLSSQFIGLPGGGTFPGGGAPPDSFIPAIDAGRIEFLRGDSNTDGSLDIADSIHTLNYLFTGGPLPPSLDAADTNNDGQVDISDPTYALNFLFVGGPAPPSPYPNCGMDTLDPPDLLPSAFHAACQFPQG